MKRSLRHRQTIRPSIALLLTTAIAALGATPAAAQEDPTDAQYDDSVTQVEEHVAGEKPAAGDLASLPFTGADAAVAGVVGLALLGSGATLRRLTAPADSQ